MIVPYPAGGTTDLLGRLVADQIKTGLSRSKHVPLGLGFGTRRTRRPPGWFIGFLSLLKRLFRG